MNMKINNFLVSHKFYDKKHRRISAFAQLLGNSLYIYIVTCSEKDIFSRKESIKRFLHYMEEHSSTFYKATADVIHPLIYNIPSTKENCRHDFMTFLYDTYLLKEQVNLHIEGTNKMMVTDVYANASTGAMKVFNARLKTIPQKQMAKYIAYLEKEKEAEEKVDQIFNMIQKVNSIEKNQDN